MLRAVVVVAASFTCVLKNVLESLRVNLASAGALHVILPKTQLWKCSRFSRFNPTIGVTCVDEMAILNKLGPWNKWPNKHGWQPSRGRTNWYYQQLLKMLCVFALDLTQQYVIWDADNVLLQRYDPFQHNGAATFLTRGNDVNRQSGHYVSALEAHIGRLPKLRKDTVTHQLAVERKYMIELLARMCPTSKHNTSMCATEIVQRIPKTASRRLGFSEYYTYYAWVVKRHLPKVYIDQHWLFTRTEKQKWSPKQCRRLRVTDPPENLLFAVYEA